MRTFVIGDLHGAGLELQFFIKQYSIKPDTDRIYLVGDIFDRGLHGHIIWNLIQDYNIKVLRGNHEQKFIQYLKGERKTVPAHYYWALNNLVDKGVKIDDFFNFLISTPLLINLDDVIIAHAGVLPENPLEENVSANIYGSLPSNLPMPIPNPKDGKTYWWDLYQGDYLVLYGHLSTFDGQPRYGYNSRGKINSIGLDTATVHGGALTAYCIEDKQIYTYKSGINYFDKLKKTYNQNYPKPSFKVMNWIEENMAKNPNTTV